MGQQKNSFAFYALLLLLVTTYLSACVPLEKSPIQPTAIKTASSTPTSTFKQTITSQPSKTPTKVPFITLTIFSTPTPEFIESDNCLKTSRQL